MSLIINLLRVLGKELLFINANDCDSVVRQSDFSSVILHPRDEIKNGSVRDVMSLNERWDYYCRCFARRSLREFHLRFPEYVNSDLMASELIQEQ